MHAELELDRQRLERPGRQARAAAAALELSELLSRGSEGARVDVPDRVLSDMVGVPTFETRTPVLDGLRQSGRVSIIGDPEVRAQIANWERAVVNVSEWELRARAFVDDHIIVGLGQRGDVGHVFRGSTAPSRPGLDPDGVTSLRVDLELRALVSHRYATASRALRGLEQLAAAMDDLMAAIRAYLDQ